MRLIEGEASYLMSILYHIFHIFQAVFNIFIVKNFKIYVFNNAYCCKLCTIAIIF